MSNRLKRGAVAPKVNDILAKMESMHHAKGIHMLLDSILFETRS